YELRLSGRASIAWAMPLSRSVTIAGEPKNAAVMTSTNPNMKAMKIRTWDTANLTSSSVTPLSRAEAIRLETPHAVSETAIAARITRTHRTRRLADREPGDGQHRISGPDRSGSLPAAGPQRPARGSAARASSGRIGPPGS